MAKNASFERDQNNAHDDSGSTSSSFIEFDDSAGFMLRKCRIIDEDDTEEISNVSSSSSSNAECSFIVSECSAFLDEGPNNTDENYPKRVTIIAKPIVEDEYVVFAEGENDSSATDNSIYGIDISSHLNLI